ncbi:outer membrane assembly lipoprotein YfiO [Pseudomonas chlororaphis]|uniref:Outer membrane assembly lipoprotein YfiO n=1 Tax=Pseudomonas chlororaphis TaxID=587753 RepID=A0A1Q8EY61_9PSED|nr:outer membrane assembly lipoprotein YfiO [Pseudomonas chlororaphis]OLF56724.1 outer membrane assembly lipoprotein YfiO [Pseudomonas chlororaphis]
MRIVLLSSLTLALGALLSTQAQASSDDSCYPRWTLLKDHLESCSSLPFLNPGNDSRVNLRLLLADSGALPLTPKALNADDLAEGYGPVPFSLSRLDPAPAPEQPEASAATADNDLNGRLESLQVVRETPQAAGDALLSGEGSRCRSNSDASAQAFIDQLIAADLPAGERQALAQGRVKLLAACNWDNAQLASLLPGAVQTTQGKGFATYLQAAGDFYSGRFSEADAGFASLKDSPNTWLQETALYMTARTALNDAQKDAFDEYGMPALEHVDKSMLQQAESGFDSYLKTYPQGAYAASAKGLLRRVHWLGGHPDKLAADYAWQMTQAKDEQRNLSLDALVEEVDTKLLMVNRTPVNTPLLLAVNDLMWMRAQPEGRLTRDALQQQKAVFAGQPALYDYLQAAFAFYVENNPDAALKQLPAEPPASLDYLAFSQQTLRGLALEAKNDGAGAQALWLQLLPLAKQPLQREQLELALAMNYERNRQLAKVFAADSPIVSPQVRFTLLRHVAGPELLRQQIGQATDPVERHTAQFVLLYKDLLRSQYAAFASDLAQLPASAPDDKLGYSLGYVYDSGQSLKLFQWSGAKAESGYTCPSIVETAATLAKDGKNPQGLNCFGEFILRNGLDGMPLDSQPDAQSLGGTEPAFKGELYSRLDGYKQVIANGKAPRPDRAYALYRAINCYAPSGYNSCGGQEVEPAVRKAWFRQLKGSFADTQWGKSLQYYW